MNKSETTSTDNTLTEKSESGQALATWLLKTGTAMKLGKQAAGGIRYEILTDRERTEPMIKITGNDRGGYVSKEILSFRKIEACIKKQEPDQPFPSKVLQAVFIGRSTNNGGFLAAVLRAEKLLALAPDAEGRHVIVGDWAEWKASLLAEPGQPIITEAAPTVEAAPDETAAEPSQVDETKAPTATRRKK